MFSRLAISSIVAILAVIAPARADDKPALTPGKYVVYYSFLFGGYDGAEQAFALIQVEKKGGDLKATLLEAAPKLPAIEIKSFKVDGRKVDIAFDLGGRKLTFEGNVKPKESNSAVGSFGDDDLGARATLIATEKEKLENDLLTRKIEAPEALTKAKQVLRKLQGLNAKLSRAKGEEARAALEKEIAAAKAEVKEKAVTPLKETVEKGDGIFAIEAGLGLMKIADTAGDAKDAAAWFKAMESAAEPFGPRFNRNLLLTIADALKTQKGYSAVVAEVVARAEKLLADNPSATIEVRFEKALLASYEKDGKADLAKQVEAKLEKLETALDKEYLAKVPPFKPKSFEGRKAKSDKVVVFELFTGSECPPCVAADVAFDALNKSYKPTDLILIQYHLHIPGPDPLTNSDTIARANFYGFRSTPSTAVDGKSQTPGGGGMSASEKKFKDYKSVIDPRLEEATSIKLEGKVEAKGDNLSITIDVDGLKPDAENLKLRLVLVEETVKLVGGNGIRFHHQVARDMPGGVAGLPLKGPKDSKKVEFDVAAVRKGLAKYLEDYSKNSEFRTSDRPLALKKLRVIALVQDDKSKEILQALQLEVPESK